MGDKKTTTNTSSDNTATTTPNVPTWAADSLQNLNGSINQLAATNPQSFVTGASPLQTQADTEGANLGTQSGALDSQAASTLGGVANSSILDGLSNYMNPYTDDVVNSTLGNMKQAEAQTGAQQEAAGAAAGAFGGSRFGVLQGTTAAQNTLNNAQEEASLRDAAYTAGTGLAQTDRSDQLTAGTDLGNLATSTNSNQIADVNAQDTLGQEQRSIAQSQATAPISLDQTIASLLGSSGYQSLSGSTTTGNSSGTSTQDVSDPTGEIGSILSGVGSGITGLSNAGGVQGLASLFG